MSKFLKYLVIGMLVALPCISAISVFFLSPETSYYSFAMNMSFAFGNFCFTLFCIELILAARVKLLDRILGLDIVYRYHARVALAALAFGLLHDKFIELAKGEIGFEVSYFLGKLSLILFAITIFFAALFMVKNMLYKISVLKKLRDFIDKKLHFDFTITRLFHNGMPFLLSLLFLHVILIPEVKEYPALVALFSFEYCIAVSFYLFHKIAKPMISMLHEYEVVAVIKEAPLITTIRFKIPENKKLIYNCGQFLFVNFLSGSMPHEEHPFTISSSPSEKKYLSITVKSVGDYTNQIDFIKVKDKAAVTLPYGIFSYSKKVKRHVFIAGGIGITPFFSMLDYMADCDSEYEVLLLWAARTHNDLIRMKDIESYSKTLKKFTFIPVLSNDPLWKGESGILDSNKLNSLIPDAFEKDAFNWNNSDYYICGPEAMRKLVSNTLKANGVKKSLIHTEAFSL